MQKYVIKFKSVWNDLWKEKINIVKFPHTEKGKIAAELTHEVLNALLSDWLYDRFDLDYIDFHNILSYVPELSLYSVDEELELTDNGYEFSDDFYEIDDEFDPHDYCSDDEVLKLLQNSGLFEMVVDYEAEPICCFPHITYVSDIEELEE